MPANDKPSLLDDIQIACRLAQITISLVAFTVAIVSVTDGYRYNGGDPNGYLMMAGIMCWFDTAALGCIGLLAYFKPQDLAWYLVLLFDCLALAASIAAPIVVCCNRHYWLEEHLLLRVVTILAWLNIIPIAISILRTALKWWQDQKWVKAWWQDLATSRRVRPRRQSDVFTPEEIRRLEKRIEQLETEARVRSTPSETIARWTTYSRDDDTLPDYQGHIPL